MANAFWGISIMRKSRQIIIDYDLDFVSQKSFDDVKEFVLARLKQGEKDPLSIEICDNVKNANSIKQIISYFI